MALDSEILKQFYQESNSVISESLKLLEDMEDDFSQKENLKVVGNKIDRIMGAAGSLARMAKRDHGLNLVADYTSLCKLVAYKGAEIQDNINLYNVTVALLLDAVESLSELIKKTDLPVDELKQVIRPNFIERLRWVLEQFNKQNPPKARSEIDDLMKKLGF